MKRGQAWGFDLMIATTIFMVGIISFYFYSINYPSEGRDALESLSYSGDLIASSLLTGGFPRDWSSGNVQRIGIVDDNKINKTKLERLYIMTNTSSGYGMTKALFNIGSDYYFNFSQEMNISGTVVPLIGREDTNSENLIKITRLISYEGRPVNVNIFVWN